MTATTFGQRASDVVAARGRLCVGIDPHAALLTDWGLPITAAGAREFAMRVIEATAPLAGFVKPQVSFFEQYGSAGFVVLEEVIAHARAAGLLVIADAKRGDIGSTMDGYTNAWLAPGSPLESDALTVSPYLGVGSLSGMLAAAQTYGKGLFVLAATSNPEAARLQTSIDDRNVSVTAQVIAEVSAFNTAHVTSAGEWGSMGFVIGATVDRQDRGIPAVFDVPAPILAPGFGAQGARLSHVGDIFGALAPTVIASESRGILRAGPDNLSAAISTRIAELEVPRG